MLTHNRGKTQEEEEEGVEEEGEEGAENLGIKIFVYKYLDS